MIDIQNTSEENSDGKNTLSVTKHSKAAVEDCSDSTNISLLYRELSFDQLVDIAFESLKLRAMIWSYLTSQEFKNSSEDSEKWQDYWMHKIASDVRVNHIPNNQRFTMHFDFSLREIGVTPEQEQNYLVDFFANKNPFLFSNKLQKYGFLLLTK